MLSRRISGRLSAAAKTAYKINGLRKSTPLFSSGIVQQKLIHYYTPFDQSCLLHNRVLGGHTYSVRDSTLTPYTLQRYRFPSFASPVHDPEHDEKDDAKGPENNSIIENEQDKGSDQKKYKAAKHSKNSDVTYINPNYSGGNSTRMDSTFNDSAEVEDNSANEETTQVEDNSANEETTQSAEAVTPVKTWWDIFTGSEDGSGGGSGDGFGGGDCGGGDCGGGDF